jgi:hypothetical protein
MTNERRYGEEEIAEIFEAASAPRTAGKGLTPQDGLSLAELTEIGGEVGIPAERISEAAAALELRRGVAPARKNLGMPVSVGRAVGLPRAPTDREWALLVAEMREAFGAHGKDRSQGELRAWTNGNLHAYIEPTAAGYRLRMGTRKGDALGLNGLGVAAILVAVVMRPGLPGWHPDGSGGRHHPRRARCGGARHERAAPSPLGRGARNADGAHRSHRAEAAQRRNRLGGAALIWI